MRAWTRRMQILFSLSLFVGMAMLNSGCVYWRLMKFKGQLEEFPEKMRIEQRDRPTLVFFDPVLKRGDPGWLLGLEPVVENESGRRDSGYATFRFVKELPGHKGGLDRSDALEARLRIEEGLVKSVGFPPRFASFLTQEHFMEIFLPIRGAMIDSRAFKTEWTWKRLNVPLPKRGDVTRHLGIPTREEEAEGLKVLRFNYLLDTDSPVPEALTMRYEFTGPEEELRRAELRIGRIYIQVDMSEELKRIRIRRLDS